MLKFAFLSQAWPEDENACISGSSVQVYYIAKELAKRGYPVLVILTAHPDYTFNNGRLQVCSVQTPNGLRNQLKASWINKIITILEEFKPDVIYQRGKLPESVVAAIYKQKHNTRFIWLSNADNSGERWKFIKKRWRKRHNYLFTALPRLLEAGYADVKIKKAIKYADVVISQTERQKKQLEKNFHFTPVVIGSGHPIPKLPLKSNDKLKILWLANLTPMKQPHLFAKLATQLHHLNADFIMAGKANNSQILEEILTTTSGYTNFKYVGGVGLNNGNQLFAHSDLFISTSWANYEGIPNTFIQALIHGTPVLSLSHDPDNIINDYQLGAISTNLEELSQDVIKFVKNQELRQSTRLTVYKYAKKQFNIETIVDQLIDIVLKNQHDSL